MNYKILIKNLFWPRNKYSIIHKKNTRVTENTYTTLYVFYDYYQQKPKKNDKVKYKKDFCRENQNRNAQKNMMHFKQACILNCYRTFG